MIQNAITQIIRKRVEDAVTDAVAKMTATTFAKKMRIDDKKIIYPAVNRVVGPPLDIVVPEDDSSI